VESSSDDVGLLEFGSVAAGEGFACFLCRIDCQ